MYDFVSANARRKTTRRRRRRTRDPAAEQSKTAPNTVANDPCLGKAIVSQRGEGQRPADSDQRREVKNAYPKDRECHHRS